MIGYLDDEKGITWYGTRGSLYPVMLVNRAGLEPLILVLGNPCERLRHWDLIPPTSTLLVGERYSAYSK